MKILITGGSGFIGRNLDEKLSGKYQIFAPTHQELELLDQKAVETFFNKCAIDVVIHCSNVGGARNTIYLPNLATTNLRVFFNILRCKKRFKRMIFLGSGAEYDKSRPLRKIREEDFGSSIPGDEYGFYKYICSEYIAQSRGIINLRLFGVYGKYEDYRLRFISEAICRNILGLPIIINQNVVFDYLYVNDLIQIIDYFIQNEPEDKFFNLGTGKSIDLLRIAKMINNISLRKSKIIVKKGGLQNEYTCDNSLLLKTIPNFNFTDFKLALKDLFDYYQGIRSSIRLTT